MEQTDTWWSGIVTPEALKRNIELDKATAKFSGEKASMELPNCTNESMAFTTTTFVLGQMLRIRPKGIIVDAGCGPTYRTLRALRANYLGNAYLGLDVRPADACGHHDTKFLTVDLTCNKVLVPESCGMVVSCEVLEHVTKKQGRRMLTNICRALVPGGHLILTTPCSEASEPKDWAEELRKYGHLYYWTRNELSEYFDNHDCDSTIFGARFLGDRRKLNKHIKEVYGEKALEMFDRVCWRFGTRIAKGIFAHEMPGGASHINCIATKRGSNGNK